VLEYDDEGGGFGRPDQIELDLIVKNGFGIVVYTAAQDLKI
jgi:hypothetical protein